MKKILIALLVLLILSFTGCGSSDEYDDDNGRYGNGKEYDENVDHIAEEFGEDPDDVDAAINALTDAINNK